MNHQQRNHATAARPVADSEPRNDAPEQPCPFEKYTNSEKQLIRRAYDNYKCAIRGAPKSSLEHLQWLEQPENQERLNLILRRD